LVIESSPKLREQEYDRITVNMCWQAVPLANPRDKERRKRGSGTWLADLKMGPVYGYTVLVCFTARNGEPPVEGDPEHPDLKPKKGPDGKPIPAVPVLIPPNPDGR